MSPRTPTADTPRPTPADGPPSLVVRDAAAWRAWLDEHESTSDGVWLTLAKKARTSRRR